ncbi:DUF1573 domain-containing protein [Marinilabilia rubra]|uniref:DUF1573 domain-containing protein n=1 Tax=Marinilabilia rubra TaxID=2162893 RepID=A0A2U2B3Q8_9BACT|nr:DUF1573 domain-containing protein [Marinilabilia rubra]PWD97702.1 DUF1573 domain-containing protein [Marinilabilia rubra]
MVKKTRTLVLCTFFTTITLVMGGCGMKPGNKTLKNDGQEIVDDKNPGQPVFSNSEHDFGEIEPGDEVGARFSFSNKGAGSLIIERVSTGCGCTVAEYSKKPVSPGDEGFVEVIFDSRGKHGAQFQQVNVYFQGLNKPSRLSIVAQVVKK